MDYQSLEMEEGQISTEIPDPGYGEISILWKSNSLYTQFHFLI